MNDICFESVPAVGDLKLDFVILEGIHLLLFTCVDKDDNLYLCDLCNDGRWLIASITIERLYGMFNNEITMRGMFACAKGICFVAKWNKDWTRKEFEIIQDGGFCGEDLPWLNSFYDTDEDEMPELQEYIDVCRIRLKNKMHERVKYEIN